MLLYFFYVLLYLYVLLGVLPKNEISYADMVYILEHIDQYLPVKEVKSEVKVPGEGMIELDDHHYHTMLVGGDHLTVAHARGASELELGGIVAVAEDWHAKQCLLEVGN